MFAGAEMIEDVEILSLDFEEGLPRSDLLMRKSRGGVHVEQHLK
jgi:hypothetical protein